MSRGVYLRKSNKIFSLCKICKIQINKNKFGYCKSCYINNMNSILKTSLFCVYCKKEFIGIPSKKYCSKRCEKSFYSINIIDKCMMCNSINVMDKHHVIMRRDGGKDLVNLCEKCHVGLHKFYNFLEQNNYKIIKIEDNIYT